uniref:Phenoloxidase-activating factor 2 n=1 Tax=Antheraea pernyi TaxID=7119 RepID=A0AA96MIA8_ANTPE|nr:serine protease-like protein 1 [Antheraea pernyi]
MYRILVTLVLAGSVHSQGMKLLNEIIKRIFPLPSIETSTTRTTTSSTAKTAMNEIKPTAFVPPLNTNETSCTLNGKDGICVPYYLCDSNNKINVGGEGLVESRSFGPCLSNLDVCCFRPDQISSTEPNIKKMEPLKLQREGCGWANPEGVGMRTTDETDGKTKFGEFPWMVAIVKTESLIDNYPNGPNGTVYVGGGSLIHPSVVLTAAHIIKDRLNLKVRAGEWDTRTTKEIYRHQERDVESIVIHKEFNEETNYYDVAVLFLKSPMDMAPNVGVVCLPSHDDMAYPDTRCFASGWGKDKSTIQGRYSTTLKKVEVQVVAHDTCQASLRTSILSYYFQLHSTFMCASGKPGKDTCKGDGGSPLVCPIQFEKDRYVQNGIVSWGIRCGETGIPGVYVDVSKVRNWIDDEVRGKGYMSEVYTY